MADRNSLSEAPLAAAPSQSGGREDSADFPQSSQSSFRPVSRHIVAGLAFIGFWVAIGFGYNLGWTWMANRSGKDGLVADAEHLNFGVIWPSTEFEWRLPIRNVSSKTVKVLGVRTSCGCTMATEGSFEVAPSATHELQLKLDVTPGRSDNLAEPLREFAVSVAPFIEGGSVRHPGWLLRGVVRNPFDISPRELLVAEDLIHGLPFPEQSVSIRFNHDLDELTVSCDEQFGSVRVVPDTADTRHATLFVNVADTLAPGDFAFDTKIHGSSAADEHEFTITYSVRGAILHDLQALPSSISFGRVSADAQPSEHVVLRTRSNRPFSILDSSAPNGVLWQSSAQSEKQRVEQYGTVSLLNVYAGVQSQSIDLNVSIDGHRAPLFQLPVRYIADDPTVPASSMDDK